MRASGVVVARVDRELAGQGREAPVQGLVQRLRAAILKIRASGPAHEQRVTGQQRTVDAQAHRVVRVPGAREHLDLVAAHGEPIAVAKPGRRDVGCRVRREQDLGARARSQLRGAGEVIGMRVGLDHEAQAQPALVEFPQVVRDAVRSRIDESGLTRVSIRDEIREAILGTHLVEDEGMCG